MAQLHTRRNLKYRGFFIAGARGGKIWMQVDNGKYTAEQIYRHEYVHELKNRQQALIDNAKAALRANLTEEQIEDLAIEYAETYLGNAQMGLDDILEEMIADSYAEMNGFTRDAEGSKKQFADDMRAYIEDAVSVENGTRGSPEGEAKY